MSVLSFAGNASVIFFHGRIWLRYSKLNNFKLSKNIIFPNTLKAKVAKAASSIGRLFASLDIHYTESLTESILNDEAQKQNEAYG